MPSTRPHVWAEVKLNLVILKNELNRVTYIIILTVPSVMFYHSVHPPFVSNQIKQRFYKKSLVINTIFSKICEVTVDFRDFYFIF